MKELLVIFVAILTLCISISGQKQPDDNSGLSKFEREVRLMDHAAAKAILERDEKGIDLYFAPNSVTSNPRGGLTYGNEGVKALFKTGVINYVSFERSIEFVQIHGNTAVVMGNESLQMAGTDGKPGELVKRRYTNIWMKNGSKWQIVARHANVVCN